MPKFYLTTSIAYVNGAPHIGYALELVQADVLCRFRRAQGDDVFFLTGTDEHGAKIARAAETVGMEPRAYADMNSEKFRALKEMLNLSWDDFIRTSDEVRHFPNAVAIWEKIAAKGDLYKKIYSGLYCVGHEAFVTEKDLVDGKCRDHNAVPEKIEEENWFFRLSKYAPEVKRLIESGEIRIIPAGRAKEIINFIDTGIEDISFSRPRKDLSWGIPVPNDDTQTMYVWCDALANYLFPKGRWPADCHMIGKDILRFHALYWPAMLLSADMPLPREIFVHGHITCDGQKMSKTLGNVVDPIELVEKYGADAVRYYLLREIPATEDGDFSLTKFAERYEADLANGLGNFAARVSALAKKYSIIVADSPEVGITAEIRRVEALVMEKMAERRFHEAVSTLWELIAFGNRYVNEKKPWDALVAEESRDEAIGNALVILGAVSRILSPFLPSAAEKIAKGETGMLFPRIGA